MTKDLVRQQFGPNAGNYAVSPVHAAGASLERLVALVSPQRDWRVLDIATGAGHTAAAFAPHVASVVASDLTDEMLAEARKLAASRGLDTMTTQRADAEELPFAQQSFDLVTCRIAPHHFPDIPRFIAEARRVLIPGGTFALVDNVAPDAETTPGYSAEALGAADVGYNLFEKIRDPSHGRALTTAAWRGLVAGAGLDITHCELLAKDMSFATWLKNMSVPDALAPRLREMLVGSDPCLTAFLRPRESDGDIVFTFMELLLLARKPA